MPFKSEAQRRFMYAKHPEIAKRFQKHTPKGADLPEHVKKSAQEAIAEALGEKQAAPFGYDVKRLQEAGGRLYEAGLKGLGNLGAHTSSVLGDLGIPHPERYITTGSPKASFTADLIKVLGGASGPLPTDALRRARLVGAGTLGAGALGAYGLYRGLKSLLGKKEEPKTAEVRIGTGFTDGFLKCCLDKGLTGEQVADMLEKGAELKDRTGSECRGLLERAAQL